MGEREVVVGCPHRLRSPIGRSTALPCAACAPFGPPGWPRRAIALTVDYGPRLSRAAVARIEPVPTEPPPPAMQPLVDALRTAARRLSATVVAHPALAEMLALNVERGPVNVVMHEQTEADQVANAVRFSATSSMRLRRR